MSDRVDSDENTATRGHRRHSVSAKIIFLVFGCTFSTALVVSLIAIQTSHSEFRDRIDRDFPATLERSREAVAAWLSVGANSLQPLLGNRNLRALASGSSGDPDVLLRTLARFESESDYYDGVAVLSGDGGWTQVGELDPTAEFTQQLGGDASSSRTIVLASEPAAALAVLPLIENQPESGYLVARYDRSRIDALLERLQRLHCRDTPGTIVLTDASGLVLAGGGGGAGSDGDGGDDDGVGFGVGDGADNRIGADHAMRELQARTQEAPTQGVHEYSDHAGVHSLGAITSLAGGFGDQWQLIVQAPFAVAFAPLLSIVTRVFVADLLIIIVFVALAHRISTRMLRPIEDLSQGARLASRGDLGQISDPGTHDEIGRLTRAFNEMMGKLRGSQAELKDANGKLQSQNEELQRANEVLSQLSITDGLTKLHNHRYFQESLTREIKRQSRNKKPLSMLLVDLDDFKALNDRLGHASGDELLVRVASIMDATVRESDLLARYGGEEFVVLTSDTDLEGAIQLAEKIRMAVEETPHIVNDSLRPVRITVSIGVAKYRGNRRLFFESADRALYRAKDQGKNCVVSTDEEGPSA
jgi:diguanylate cyclase (GGDEF)-like protein